MTIEELKNKAAELNKLLSFLEIHAYNKLNSLIMKQVHGIDSLAELLKCYGNKIGDDNVLIQVESKLLKCIAICSRNDMIANQLLDDPENVKNVAYVVDIIEEQFSMIKWNQEDILRDDLTYDSNLLEQCFRVIQ